MKCLKCALIYYLFVSKKTLSVFARELLWKGLESIGAEHREILVLKELEGFRYAEIAQILDIPEGTVASRLYHARSALKGALVEMDAEYP